MYAKGVQKAYDSVEWVFIEQVLTELGFPWKMVRWIMQCISTFSCTFMVNGEMTSHIQAKKGLRQGDPMSPYVFVLAMEYLDRCLQSLKKEPDFYYHPRCQKLDIVHLYFADDLLMFAIGDTRPVQLLFENFNIFSVASWLNAKCISEGSKRKL